MTKEGHKGPNQEDLELQGQKERYADYMAKNPDREISPANRRACEPEIAKFEGMLDEFEVVVSLDELNSIIDLTAEEAPKHPVREPARVALGPILAKLHTLRDETNISQQKYEELRLKWKRLDRAVGIINKDSKVDHNR